MQFDQKKAKKVIIICAIAYLIPGFILGTSAWVSDLRTFKCDDANAPHRYITMGTGSFKNPDTENCARRGLELHSIAIVPIFAITWPVMIGGRVINSLNNRVIN